MLTIGDGHSESAKFKTFPLLFEHEYVYVCVYTSSVPLTSGCWRSGRVRLNHRVTYIYTLRLGKYAHIASAATNLLASGRGRARYSVFRHPTVSHSNKTIPRGRSAERRVQFGDDNLPTSVIHRPVRIYIILRVYRGGSETFPNEIARAPWMSEYKYR